MGLRCGALCSFKLGSPWAFFLSLRTNIFDWSDRPDDIERGCLKSWAQLSQSGLISSILQQVPCQQQLRLEVEQRGQSRSVHSACFEDRWMNDLLPRKSQQLRELFPSPSSSWLPWLSASPALRINNERFIEQLRQVQAYLMSLRQKEILP